MYIRHLHLINFENLIEVHLNYRPIENQLPRNNETEKEIHHKKNIYIKVSNIHCFGLKFENYHKKKTIIKKIKLLKELFETITTVILQVCYLKIYLCIFDI